VEHTSQASTQWPPGRQGLYDPTREHDACGLGFIAHIKGHKSHAIVEHGLRILENLTHRGATGGSGVAGGRVQGSPRRTGKDGEADQSIRSVIL